MQSSFDRKSRPRTLADLGYIAVPVRPVKPGGVDPEEDSKAELNELQAGFAARAKAENARRELATDSEYWCCLVFQTREQAEAFAAKFGDPDEKYMDGRKVARALGVELPPSPASFGRVKIDRKLSTMA